MRIMTIIDGFPPEHSGGSEHVALNLSLGIKDAGNEVVVVTTTQDKKMEGESSHEGLRIIRIFSSYDSKFLESYLGVFNPFIKNKFVKTIKSEKPDIVHFHNIHKHISYAAFKWVRDNSRASIFFTAHDVMSFSYSRLTHFIDPANPVSGGGHSYKLSFFEILRQAGRAYNPFRNTLIRNYFLNVKKIFVVSDALGQAFIQNGISNVQTIYNGIDMSRLNLSEEDVKTFKNRYSLNNKKVILFAGRSMSAKGLVPLINSLPAVISKVPNAVLAIAINPFGKYADFIRGVISKMNLTQHIVILGLLKDREWSAMFNAVDVVTVPSIYFDPAPLVTMEAMAAKKPVVGTCFGGTPEIMEDKETGFVVNPYNQGLLSDKIIELLNDEILSQKFGLKGFERLKSSFTIKHQVSEVLQAYATLK